MRAEIRGDLAELRGEFRAELSKGYANLQRSTVATMIGIAGFVLTIVLAVNRFGS